MCVTNIVNFNLPIGWDELGVIATVLAVIVALYSNRKATKQLKSALEIQEQSKNVGLLDKRIELTEKIRSNKSVPEWTLRVLFDNNANIVGHYTAWQNYLSEARQAQDEISNLNLWAFYACPSVPLSCHRLVHVGIYIHNTRCQESNLSPSAWPAGAVRPVNR